MFNKLNDCLPIFLPPCSWGNQLKNYVSATRWDNHWGNPCGCPFRVLGHLGYPQGVPLRFSKCVNIVIIYHNGYFITPIPTIDYNFHKRIQYT